MNAGRGLRDPVTVGVISPYKKQCDLIEDLVEHINPVGLQVKVNSVDGFQACCNPSCPGYLVCHLSCVHSSNVPK